MIPWRDLLDFERTAPSGPTRARAIRERFGISDARYYSQLGRVIDTPHALAADPVLVSRLLRRRDRFRTIRFAQRLESRAVPMVPETPAAEEPTQLAFEDQVRDMLKRAAEFEHEAGAILGQARRDRGIALVDSAVSEVWKDRADMVIRILAATGVEFTAEDVRKGAGDPPNHPNAMGARIHWAARHRLIRRVRYEHSTRPSLHRHPIAVWVGVEDAGQAASA